MNKIWIALLVAFTVTFVGCDEPAVVPDPEIVTFTVQPGTAFTSGDKITVNFEAKNAVANENNIGAPTTTSWTYVLTASLNITNIKVTAINSEGKKASSNIDITVAPPYIPTAKDTLMSSSWVIESSVGTVLLDNGVEWYLEEKYPDGLKDTRVTFYTNFRYIATTYFNGTHNYIGEWSWAIDLEKRMINFSGWKSYSFVGNKMILTFPGLYRNTEGKEYPVIWKRTYVRN